jgi:hypothetical protein
LQAVLAAIVREGIEAYTRPVTNATGPVAQLDCVYWQYEHLKVKVYDAAGAPLLLDHVAESDRHSVEDHTHGHPGAGG